MSQPTAQSPGSDPEVEVPAGLPLLEAARWVGESCWLELWAHGALTSVLADPDAAGHADRVELWRVRANRADTAEAWHRRLPELREYPRHTFVVRPSDPDVGAELDALAGADRPLGLESAARIVEVIDARYAAHETVAVGPADGPARLTLSRARVLLAADRAALRR